MSKPTEFLLALDGELKKDLSAPYTLLELASKSDCQDR